MSTANGASPARGPAGPWSRSPSPRSRSMRPCSDSSLRSCRRSRSGPAPARVRSASPWPPTRCRSRAPRAPARPRRRPDRAAAPAARGVGAGGGGLGLRRGLGLVRRPDRRARRPGIGSASSWIAALALVSDSAPEGKRGQWLGVALGATSVGSIADPRLAAWPPRCSPSRRRFDLRRPRPRTPDRRVARPPWEAPRSRPAVPALSAIMRSVRSATGAWSATISLTSAGVLGLIEVVAPLDLDARLGVSSAAIGLLFAGSIAVDAALSPVGGAGAIAAGAWADHRPRSQRLSACSSRSSPASPGRRSRSLSTGRFNPPRSPQRFPGSTRPSRRPSAGSPTASRTCSTPAGM